MTVLRVTLFGKLSVQHHDRCLPGFDGRKVRDLFSYLLLRRNKPHLRENLATLLWPETDLAHAKNYLRKTLWQLQTALENVAPTLLTADTEWIELRAAAPNDLWLDVAQLEETLGDCRDIPGTQLAPACHGRLQQIVQLYQGPLLEDCYEPWVLQERQRLEQLYLLLLDKLMEHAEAAGNLEQGLALGMRALQIDAAREHTHRSLMRLYARAGKRTEALRQYQRCHTHLQVELGVGPSRQTQTLYQQICQDGLLPQKDTIILINPNNGEPANSETATAELLATMRDLQSLLTQTQQQLRQ